MTQWRNPLPPNKLVVQDNVALAIVDLQDHRVNPAVMVAMVPTANRASLENEATQLLRTKVFWTSSRNNARAKLHLAIKVHRVRKDPTDHLAMLVNQAAMANPEIKDHEDPTAKMANPEMLDKKAHRENLAKQHRKSDPLAHLEAQANQVNLVHLANLADLAKMVNQADLEVPEMPDHLVAMANLVQMAPMANQENKATQEAAPTAHRLVWLQAIKPRSLSFRNVSVQQHSHDYNNFSASTTMFFLLFANCLFKFKD